jgi:hypothetical protein
MITKCCYNVAEYLQDMQVSVIMKTLSNNEPFKICDPSKILVFQKEALGVLQRHFLKTATLPPYA